jgi:hypothetical protein
MWLFVCSFQLATFRISQRTVFAVLNVVWQAQTNKYFQSVSLAVFLCTKIWGWPEPTPTSCIITSAFDCSACTSCIIICLCNDLVYPYPPKMSPLHLKSELTTNVRLMLMSSLYCCLTCNRLFCSAVFLGNYLWLEKIVHCCYCGKVDIVLQVSFIA